MNRRIFRGKNPAFTLCKWSKTAYNLKCKYLEQFLQKEVTSACIYSLPFWCMAGVYMYMWPINNFSNFYPSSTHSLTAQLINYMSFLVLAWFLTNSGWFCFPLFLKDQFDNLDKHTQWGIDFLEKYAKFVKERIEIEQNYAKQLR